MPPDTNNQDTFSPLGDYLVRLTGETVLVHGLVLESAELAVDRFLWPDKRLEFSAGNERTDKLDVNSPQRTHVHVLSFRLEEGSSSPEM